MPQLYYNFGDTDVTPEKWENLSEMFFKDFCSKVMFAPAKVFKEMWKADIADYDFKRNEGKYIGPYGELDFFPCNDFQNNMAIILDYEKLEPIFKKYLQNDATFQETIHSNLNTDQYIELYNLTFTKEKPEKGKIDKIIDQLKELKENL